jgi:hypothetical protein
MKCPDCDRPNQFGELCDSCRQDRETEIEEDGPECEEPRKIAPCPVCGSGVADAHVRHLDWRGFPDTWCDGPAS